MANTAALTGIPYVGVPMSLVVSLEAGRSVLSYQWKTSPDPAGNLSNISGAIRSTYTPTEDLVGLYLHCTVTLDNAAEVETTDAGLAKGQTYRIRKHTAASTGPRFRITRSSSAPRAKTSFEVARESGQA